MRQTTFIVLALLCAGFTAQAWGQGYPADTTAQRDLLSTIQGGPKALAAPDVHRDGTGHIYFVLPPEGAYMDPPTDNRGPGETARRFIGLHRNAFGVRAGAADFPPVETFEAPGRDYARTGQTYGGVPVFGAGATVALDPRGRVAWVVTDLMKNTRPFDDGEIPLTPAVTLSQAQRSAAAALKNDFPLYDFEPGAPELYVYDPAVLGADGGPALVWQVDVACMDTPLIAERVLVDAHTQVPLLRYSLVYGALDRRIFDGGNVLRGPYDTGPLVRVEGDPPLTPESQWTDVNDMYDFFGDTYAYYKDNHGRDSLDGAGLPLEGVANYCDPSMGCPMLNAFWTSLHNRMYFGNGLSTDDIIAHELTHGVTSWMSKLIYYGESGALNEMMSDVWAEAVDMTNGAGLDGPEYDWLVGEGSPLGVIRNLKNPSEHSTRLFDLGGQLVEYPMPDYYKGPGWYEGFSDSGGVHHNMSVGTKLFYLLAAGDDFRGFSIAPMGIVEATELWYRAQQTLPMGSDHPTFGSVLIAAARDLGFSGTEQSNVFKALLAVNIAQLPEGDPLQGFRAYSQAGSTDIALTWQPPNYNLADVEEDIGLGAVRIVYRDDRFPDEPDDGTVIFEGTADSTLHTGLTPGQEAFYAAFSIIEADGEDAGWLERLRTRAVVGEPTFDVLSEPFDLLPAAGNMMDLEFSQILFTPIMDLQGASDSGAPGDYVIYSGYQATFKPNVTTLPVARSRETFLPMLEDDVVGLPIFKENTQDERPVVFPFFGRFFSTVYAGENGYIAFEPLVRSSSMYGEDGEDTEAAKYNTPSYANHFAIPRISFLFSDLSHASGGEAWFRYMEDRFVLTYESIPWRNPEDPNFEDKASTVQLELFYSGHIRMTFLALSAERAIVGLSDGDGLPRDPAPIFGSKVVYDGLLASDLSALPPAGGLAIQPIPLQFGDEGDTIEFTASVTAESPTPEWSISSMGTPLPETAVLLDEGRTATFTWPTQAGDGGTHQLRICAAAQGKKVCQDVLLFLEDIPAPPTALNVTLSPESAARNNMPLTFTYDYSHPRDAPEAGTIINWFRNDSLIPALENRTRLSAEGTKLGDVWRVRVTPVAVVDDIAVEGEPVFSNQVRIVDNVVYDVNFDGRVDAVDLQIVINAVLGQPVPDPSLPDVNNDGTVNALDIQLETLALLGLR